MQAYDSKKEDEGVKEKEGGVEKCASPAKSLNRP